jgi:hypothetical protein
MAYAARQYDCPFVISWRRAGITEVKTAWNKARQRAKVRGLLVHDLRRTAIRNVIRAGIPEKQAMRISGHKSRSIFDRYDITDERDIQLAGQKLARYLEEKGKVVTKEVTARPRRLSPKERSFNNFSSLDLAPQVGFEPTTACLATWCLVTFLFFSARHLLLRCLVTP